MCISNKKLNSITIKNIQKHITEDNRIKLKKWDYFWHFSPSLFFLILPIIFLCFTLKSFFTDNQIELNRMLDGIGLIIVFIFISIIIFIYKYRILKFKTLEVRISVKQFHEVIELTRNELKWIILEQNNNYAFAYSKKSMFSWGEQITIIRENNVILINSICKTYNTSLFGNNQINIEVFERNLKKANAQQRV